MCFTSDFKYGMESRDTENVQRIPNPDVSPIAHVYSTYSTYLVWDS